MSASTGAHVFSAACNDPIPFVCQSKCGGNSNGLLASCEVPSGLSDVTISLVSGGQGLGGGELITEAEDIRYDLLCFAYGVYHVFNVVRTSNDRVSDMILRFECTVDRECGLKYDRSTDFAI